MEDVVKLVRLLQEKGLTIASCESFTAGLFASTLGRTMLLPQLAVLGMV